MNLTISGACPCCGSLHVCPELEFHAVPVSGVFRDAASEPLSIHDLVFEVCSTCGLLRNRNFAAPPDYSVKPRPTARQLPVFQDRLLDMVAGAVNKEDLILEIGSNDGSFLDLLKANGYANSCGVEPSEELARIAKEKGHRVVKEYFAPSLVESLIANYGAPKMVICRHTLEHVPDPALFIQGLRALLVGSGGTALIEVPDSTAIMEGVNFVEFWDEHLYYFTPYTLQLLMERSGLKVTSQMALGHLETRNLLMHVEVGATAEKGRVLGEALMWRDFFANFKGLSGRIRNAVLDAPKPIYVIGASHPQCNFINYLDLGQMVDFMIDDDPAKLGRLPPICSDAVCIISSEDFRLRAQGGTLLSTGFGYERWTRQLSEIALSKGLEVMDPRLLIELTP